MPDTGAPWNIPYVAGTDLVADWPTDSQTLATAIADGLDAAIGVVQTASAAQSATFTTTSTSFTDVTALEVTITPSSASNDVILTWSLVSAVNAGGVNYYFRLYEDATGLGLDEFTQTSASSGYSETLSQSLLVPAGSTSARTYKLRCRTASDTLTLVRGQLIAVEVAV